MNKPYTAKTLKGATREVRRLQKMIEHRDEVIGVWMDRCRDKQICIDGLREQVRAAADREARRAKA